MNTFVGMYVLMVVTSNGYKGGLDVEMHDFTSQGQCEYALSLIKETVDYAWCVPK